MEPTLPKVIEFSHLHDVKLETHDGITRVVARVKPSKYDRGYKSAHDLPYIYRDTANNRFSWFYVPKADNWREQQERGDYFWNEFVRFARGYQKRRRAEAIGHAKSVIRELFKYQDCQQEASRFTEHLAEALIAHLRVGLDEAKTDTQLQTEAAA